MDSRIPKELVKLHPNTYPPNCTGNGDFRYLGLDEILREKTDDVQFSMGTSWFKVYGVAGGRAGDFYRCRRKYTPGEIALSKIKS